MPDAGGMAGSSNFQYSGVDAETARNLFESLFGGAGTFGGNSSRSGGGQTRFQFFTAGE